MSKSLDRLKRNIQSIYDINFKGTDLEHFKYTWSSFKIIMYPNAIDFTSAVGKVHQIKWELHDDDVVDNITIGKYVIERVVTDVLNEYLRSIKK